MCAIIWGTLMHIYVDLGYENINNELEEEEVSHIIQSSMKVTILPHTSDDIKIVDQSTTPNTLSDTTIRHSKMPEPHSTPVAPTPTYDKCWKGYSNYNILWIITGPMTLVLFVSYHF